jgi:Rrf2 family protein
MQISKGVEWAVHATSLMSGLPENAGLKAETLADYHGVPKAYMAKQLQALSKAGLVRTSRGAHGGYRLAKPSDEISLWDIMTAIEGGKPAFRCTEIRQTGPCALKPKDCHKSCPYCGGVHGGGESLSGEPCCRFPCRSRRAVCRRFNAGAFATFDGMAECGTCVFE